MNIMTRKKRKIIKNNKNKNNDKNKKLIALERLKII